MLQGYIHSFVYEKSKFIFDPDRSGTSPEVWGFGHCIKWNGSSVLVQIMFNITWRQVSCFIVIFSP
jgi:hypothetical protein